MTVELVIAIAAVVGVIATGSGQVVAFRRNGSHQAARDREQAKILATRDADITNNQTAILERLDDKENGLQAVNSKVTAQALHCSEIAGPLIERVNGHDREIKELKRK